MNMFFNFGSDFSRVGKLANIMWVTFGKLIFVTSVMVLLINICKTNESIPKAIANCASIQLIGNLSFAMYGWHYIVIFYSIGVSQTYAYWADYNYYGVFLWVIFWTFLLAFWTVLIIEYPFNDLWRIIEAPFIRRFK